MKLLSALFLTVFVLDKSNAENPAWEAYKIRYGCVFDSVEEDQKREAIWEQNLNELVSKQKKFAANGKLPPFRLGINKFSMFTYDEKVEKFTGLNREARERRRRMLDTKAAKIHKRNVNLVTNSTVDWRNTPLVGPVKNQGGCG